MMNIPIYAKALLIAGVSAGIAGASVIVFLLYIILSPAHAMPAPELEEPKCYGPTEALEQRFSITLEDWELLGKPQAKMVSDLMNRKTGIDWRYDQLLYSHYQVIGRNVAFISYMGEGCVVGLAWMPSNVLINILLMPEA